MDLSENRSNHPNLIISADAQSCTVGQTQHKNSIIIPTNGEVTECQASSAEELTADLIEKICAYQPEVIVLATGREIVFPDPDVLDSVVKQNIGFEVLSNQAAARTFNVLLSENRQVVCLMII